MPPKKCSAAKAKGSEFKPWEIGRRTGKNIRAGKVIRVDKNGFEKFEDYFGGNISGSDSSINITLDHTLHANKSLLQNGSNDSKIKNKGKKLATKKAEKSTNKADRSIRMVRDIGRRTLKPIRLGKNIRKDEQGFELFEDYFTDHELSSSTICLSVNQSSLIDSDDNEISFGKKDSSRAENLLSREVIREDEKENQDVYGDEEDNNDGDSTGQYDSAPESPPSSGQSDHGTFNKSSTKGNKSIIKSSNKTLTLSPDGVSESNLTGGFDLDVSNGNHDVSNGNHDVTNNSASETGSFNHSLGFSAQKSDNNTFSKDLGRRRSSRNRSSTHSLKNSSVNKSHSNRRSKTNSFQGDNNMSASVDRALTETEEQILENKNNGDIDGQNGHEEEIVQSQDNEEENEIEKEELQSEENEAGVEDLQSSQDGDWETIDVEERREYLRRNNTEYLKSVTEVAHEFSCSLKDDGSGEDGEKTRIRSTSQYDPSKLSQTITAMVSFMPGQDDTCEEGEVRITDNDNGVVITKFVNQTLTHQNNASLNSNKSSLTLNKSSNRSRNESSNRNSSQNQSLRKSKLIENGVEIAERVEQSLNHQVVEVEIPIDDDIQKDQKEERLSGINVAGGITGSITKDNNGQKNSPAPFKTKKRLSYSGMEETLNDNMNLSKRERKSQKSMLATVNENHPLHTSSKGNNSNIGEDVALDPNEKSRIIRNAGKCSSVSRNKSIINKTNLETGETTGSDVEKSLTNVTNNKSNRSSKNCSSFLNSTRKDPEDKVEFCDNRLDNVSSAELEANSSQQNKSLQSNRRSSRNKSLNKSGTSKAKIDIVSGTSSTEDQSDSNKTLHKTNIDKNTSTSGLPTDSSIKNSKITKEIETNTTPLELQETKLAESRKRLSNESEIVEKLKQRSSEAENLANVSDDSVVKPKSRRRTVVIDDHSISNVEQDSSSIIQSSSSDEVMIHDGLDLEEDERIPVNIAESTRIDGNFNKIPIDTPKSGISFRSRRVRTLNDKSFVRSLHRTAIEKSHLVEQTRGQVVEQPSVIEQPSVAEQPSVVENLFDSMPATDGAMCFPTINSNNNTPRVLTPCLVQPGSLSAQKRNPRRVTIAEDEVSENEEEGGKGAETFSDLTESIHHYCDVTNTHHSPVIFKKPEKKRIIYPEPAPDGLRRSSRVRVQRLEGYKNERIIYDRRRKSGVHVLGIQPSNEAKYLAHSEKLKNARLKRIRMKKAKQKRQKYGRNLSIHGTLPDDLNLTFGTDLPIVNPETQTEVLMTCISQQDSYMFIGPSGNVPKASDPYVMCQSLNQKSFTSGELNLRPHGEKPLQKVVNNTLVVRVIFGKVAVTIHRKVSVLETGDVFFVPSGAVYKLKNLRNEEAKLFYMNIVQVEESESERESESDHSTEEETSQ